MTDLSVQLGRLRLPNPVMTAAGCVGYGLEYAPLVDWAQAGALVVKTITLTPRAGNPPPRVAETPAGMLHAIGLQNEGVETFVLEILPRLRTLGTPLIVSIGGETVAGYRAVAGKLSQAEGIAALEVNLACPDTEEGHAEFGLSSERTAQVIEAVRNATPLPLIAKLSPNGGDPVPIARAAVAAGAESLCLINSPWGMAVDAHSQRFRLATPIGGLSGPAIKPIALYHVWRVRQAMPETPLIGVGGICSWEDAVEFMLVGASAVQVGTAHYMHPQALMEILAGLRAYAESRQLERIEALVGALA
ncbi:MAG: dihydroorotate dehydrogenase [Fimbriimonadales bacterium]|nr:MAG: dihydroorotate dehydrogenase [Fimbriimonadales bacterium]